MIETREEYGYAVERGYEPLIDARLPMTHALRVEVQKERFGKNDAEGNHRFYRFCLSRLPLICEECRRPIRSPSAYNVSHIISRGADARMAHDPRNVNILCEYCHERWEHSTTRVGMRILRKNKKRIEQLKREYNGAE